MKQLEITLRVRNNLLVQRRLEIGHATQVSMAKALGMSVMTYNSYETLRQSPVCKDGWRAPALAIASFHGVSPETLWPNIMREIKERTLTLYEDIGALTSGSTSLALPPSFQMDYQEMNDQIARHLNHLNPRQQHIVRMRFGMAPYDSAYTFEAIGCEIGVTKTRATQLFHEAIRKLRHEATGLEEYWPDMNQA